MQPRLSFWRGSRGAQQAAVEVLEERTMLWWHRHMQDWSARIDALGKVASSVESESAAVSAIFGLHFCRVQSSPFKHTAYSSL